MTYCQTFGNDCINVLAANVLSRTLVFYVVHFKNRYSYIRICNESKETTIRTTYNGASMALLELQLLTLYDVIFLIYFLVAGNASNDIFNNTIIVIHIWIIHRHRAFSTVRKRNRRIFITTYIELQGINTKANNISVKRASS